MVYWLVIVQDNIYIYVTKPWMDETSSYINGNDFTPDWIRTPDVAARSLVTTPTTVFQSHNSATSRQKISE